jgi:hypothetical protein
MHNEKVVPNREPFHLDDLDEPIVPASPVTSVAGGVLFVVVVLAMVPGAVDTSYRKP